MRRERFNRLVSIMVCACMAIGLVVIGGMEEVSASNEIKVAWDGGTMDYSEDKEYLGSGLTGGIGHSSHTTGQKLYHFQAPVGTRIKGISITRAYIRQRASYTVYANKEVIFSNSSNDLSSRDDKNLLKMFNDNENIVTLSIRLDANASTTSSGSVTLSGVEVILELDDSYWGGGNSGDIESIIDKLNDIQYLIENIDMPNIPDYSSDITYLRNQLDNLMGNDGAIEDIQQEIENISTSIETLIDGLSNDLGLRIDNLSEDMELNIQILKSLIESTTSQPIITLNNTREDIYSQDGNVTLIGKLTHQHPNGATIKISSNLDDYGINASYNVTAGEDVGWGINYNNLQEGIYNNVEIKATDSNNRTTKEQKIGNVYVDNTPPDIHITGVPTEWVPNSITMRVRATDTVSGVKSIEQVRPVEVGGNIVYQPIAGSLVQDNQAEYDIHSYGEHYIKVTDNAGNSKISEPIIAKIAKGNSSILVEKSETEPTNQDIKVRAYLDFPAGAALVRYEEGTRQAGYFIGGIVGEPLEILDGAENGMEYSEFTATDNQAYTVYVKDNTGHELVEAVDINNIDKVKPTINSLDIQATENSAVIRVGATDNKELHEMAYGFRIDNGDWSDYTSENEYKFNGLTSEERYTAQVRVRDRAGNVGQSKQLVFVATDSGLMGSLREWLSERFGELFYPEDIQSLVDYSEYMQLIQEVIANLGSNPTNEDIQNAIENLNRLIKANSNIQNKSITINELEMIVKEGSVNQDYLSDYREYLKMYKDDLERELQQYDIQLVVNAVNGVRIYEKNRSDSTRETANTEIEKLQEGNAKTSLLGRTEPIKLPSDNLIEIAMTDISSGADILKMESMDELGDEQYLEYSRFLDGAIDSIIVNYGEVPTILSRNDTTKLKYTVNDSKLTEYRITPESMATVENTTWKTLENGNIKEDITYNIQGRHLVKLKMRTKDLMESEEISIYNLCDWQAPEGRIIKENATQSVTSEGRIKIKVDIKDNLRTPRFIKVGKKWDKVPEGYFEYNLGDGKGLKNIELIISDMNGNKRTLKESIWKI